jgi:TPR repeat protein
MHKYGNGVSRNISLAKEYLKKSADKGNEYAQREYAELEMSN